MNYRHCRLGYIAEKGEDDYHFVTPRNNELGTHTYIPKELIEESNDRESIEEKDWIDETRIYLAEGKAWSIDTEKSKEQFREAINKYQPKITFDDACERINNDFASPENLINFVKSKGVITE